MSTVKGKVRSAKSQTAIDQRSITDERTVGGVDLALLVANKILLVGWSDPHSRIGYVRIKQHTPEVSYNHEPEGVGRYFRPDLAEKLTDGLQASAGFVMEVPDFRTNVDGSCITSLTIDIFDSDGRLMSSGQVSPRLAIIGHDNVEGSETGFIELALDSGCFSSIATAVLRRQLDVRGLVETTKIYVDFAYHGIDMILVEGWFDSAGLKSVAAISDDLSAYSSPEMYFPFVRFDVSQHLRSSGFQPTTDLHGFTLFAKPNAASEAAITLYELDASGAQMIGRVGFEYSLDKNRAAMAVQHRLGDGRHPSPDQAIKFLLPLFGTSKTIETVYDVDDISVVTGAIDVSVIVPLYGNPIFIRSIASQISLFPENWEIVLVCDDPRLRFFMGNYLSDRAVTFNRNVRVIYNKYNYGYSSSNNIGISESRADIILLMNSDIWFVDQSPLLAAKKLIDESPATILGFRLLYEDDTVQHDGISFGRSPFVHGNFLADHPGKGLPAGEVSTNAPPPLAVTGALMMVHKQHFNNIGGFDENYILGDFEDVALCLQNIKFGGQNAIIRTDKIYHLERQSMKLIGGDAYRSTLTYLNCLKFNADWAYLIDSKAGEQAT